MHPGAQLPVSDVAWFGARESARCVMLELGSGNSAVRHPPEVRRLWDGWRSEECLEPSLLTL